MMINVKNKYFLYKILFVIDGISLILEGDFKRCLYTTKNTSKDSIIEAELKFNYGVPMVGMRRLNF